MNVSTAPFVSAVIPVYNSMPYLVVVPPTADGRPHEGQPAVQTRAVPPPSIPSRIKNTPGRAVRVPRQRSR
ncbi:hypothetical protein [Streptomyces sp. NPDC006551]|uniref:hypothetical protein n=1 Tax=Streptomyces sp. NPDC006551 TaxID=3157178 RepID=UPI0033AEA6CC